MEASVIVSLISTAGTIVTGYLSLLNRKEVKEVKQKQRERDWKGIWVIVLEDNLSDLDLIRRTIEADGHKYKLYDNEDDYLAELTDDINVHVIDHLLIRMSGLDIVREIKSRNQGNFVIAFTGTDDDNVHLEYTNNGADRIVDKNKTDPFKKLAIFINQGLRIAANR